MAVVAEFELAAREAASDETAMAEPDQFRFGGELFALAEDVSTLPMMRYAAALGTKKLTTVYAAAFNLLTSVVAPADWDRFERLATERHATYRELIGVAEELYGVIVARPTRRPSGSPGGPQTTTDDSNPDSSSPATPPLRPDLAVPMVSVESLVSGG